ncbi:MAG: tail fiber domain-containing protein, partial [bacterium]
MKRNEHVDKIKKLKPITYKSKFDGLDNEILKDPKKLKKLDKTEFGFTAEEMYEIYPEAVAMGEPGTEFEDQPVGIAYA